MRRTINNLFRNKTPLRESQSTGVRLKYPLNLRDQGKLHQKVREAATRWPHWPSPRTVQHYAERSSLSRWFLQREKRTQGGQPISFNIVGCSVGAPTLISHYGNCRGIYVAQPLGICDREAGRGLQQSTHRSWQTVHICSVWVVNPTSDIVGLQNQIRGTLWPGNLGGGGTDLTDSDPQRSFISPRAHLSTPRQGAES